MTDPSGAVLPNAKVTILNRITNYQQTATTDSKGAFRLTNIPPNPYHVEVSAPNFATSAQDVDVRSTVPVSLKVSLMVAGAQQTVTVEANGADLLENVPYAHNDVDISSLSKLSVSSPGAGVSDAVVLSSGAVAADSNGFFHPLGDHAQTSFSVDGQPISDQQSKAFSTQIPLDAIQSMELITGTPPAEFGDKTSLIVNAVTRSGLGQKPNGSFIGAAQLLRHLLGGGHVWLRRREGGKFPGRQHAPLGTIPRYTRASADSRHRHQRNDLRPLRLQSRTARTCFTSTSWARGTGFRSPTRTISWGRTSGRRSRPSTSLRDISTSSARARC